MGCGVPSVGGHGLKFFLGLYGWVDGVTAVKRIPRTIATKHSQFNRCQPPWWCVSENVPRNVLTVVSNQSNLHRASRMVIPPCWRCSPKMRWQSIRNTSYPGTSNDTIDNRCIGFPSNRIMWMLAYNALQPSHGFVAAWSQQLHSVQA